MLVQMHFASTWNHLQKHCISVDFFLVEGYGQGALRKELHILPFVQHFKGATSGSLADDFCQYLEQFI